MKIRHTYPQCCALDGWSWLYPLPTAFAPLAPVAINLATAYAGLKKEKEAFKYLRKAIIKGWKMVDFEEQPEWQPYRHSITNRAVNQIRMKEETR